MWRNLSPLGFALSVHLCTSSRTLNLCTATAYLAHSSVTPLTHHTPSDQAGRDSQLLQGYFTPGSTAVTSHLPCGFFCLHCGEPAALMSQLRVRLETYCG